MDPFLIWFVWVYICSRVGDTAELLAKTALRKTGRIWPAWVGGVLGSFYIMKLVFASIAITQETFYVMGAAALVVPFLLSTWLPRMFPRLAEAEKRLEIETKTRRELEDDADYQAANETAERIRGLLARTEWSDARRFVEDMVTEQIPTLIRLRRELAQDRERLTDLIGKQGRGVAKQGRRTALTATRDRLNALHDQASERIAASTDALAELLVIARERQLNDSPDAIDRADQLLAETRRANDLLLATRHEVESVGKIN